MRITAALICLFLSLPGARAADYPPGAETGPRVPGYGPVFPVVDGAYALANDHHYRITKDISATADSPDQLNRHLDSVARLLNMQARAGTPPQNLDVAVVVHGAAGRDMLSDAAYRRRFGTDNPNTGLLAALGDAGVAIYLCGQTVRLQSEGYTLIPF